MGIAVLVWALSSTERRRERAAGKLGLGDPAARVTQLLGPPAATCPPGSVEHLREHLPAGFPPAAEEETLGRLQVETAERWVYPLDGGEEAGCAPAEGMTEVGLDRSRRVLWYVPVTGKTPMVFPEEYLPEGSGEA